MTLTAWDIYWVTRLDEISIAMGISMWVMIFVCAIAAVVYCMSDFKITGAKKLIYRLLPWIVGVTLVNTLIPNTKQAAAMYVLPAIVNSDAVQQLPGELTILAREWLHELRPSQVSKKDSK